MTVQWSTAVRNAMLTAFMNGSVDGFSGSAWAQSTGYTAFTSWVTANGNIYLCRTTGTSSNAGSGPSGTGTNITDGTCAWVYIGSQGIGPAAVVEVRTGTQPATCATATSGTLLVKFSLATSWASVSAAAITMSSTPISATASNTGTAGYYRIFEVDDATCCEQGAITATGGGGDMTIDNTSIASGQTVQITSYVKTAPGA